MKALLNLLVFISMSFTISAQCLKGDCKNGEGVQLYKSGNKYMGNFTEGKRHGFGKFIWVSGAKYKGNWKNNQRHGYGEEFWANGYVYKGDFYNNKKHGTGALYNSENEIIKEGIWKNGVFTSKKESPFINDKKTEISGHGLRPAFERYINVGIGFGSALGGNFPLTNGDYSSLPPLSLSIDFKKMDKNLTLSGYVAYASDKINYSDSYFGDWGWKTNYIILGLRGTHQFNLIDNEKIVTYAGAMIGYNLVKSEYFGEDLFSDNVAASASSITYSGFLGTRYQFNNKMGVFAEIGYGIALLNVGVSCKF